MEEVGKGGPHGDVIKGVTPVTSSAMSRRSKAGQWSVKGRSMVGHGNEVLMGFRESEWVVVGGETTGGEVATT